MQACGRGAAKKDGRVGWRAALQQRCASAAVTAASVVATVFPGMQELPSFPRLPCAYPPVPVRFCCMIMHGWRLQNEPFMRLRCTWYRTFVLYGSRWYSTSNAGRVLLASRGHAAHPLPSLTHKNMYPCYLVSSSDAHLVIRVSTLILYS